MSVFNPTSVIINYYYLLFSVSIRYHPFKGEIKQNGGGNEQELIDMLALILRRCYVFSCNSPVFPFFEIEI